jgi:hypothetical protein
MLDDELWQSDAWWELNGAAIRVWIFLRSRTRGRYYEALSHKIMVSYDDIQNGTADKNLKNRTGLAIQTIRTAIVQLVRNL